MQPGGASARILAADLGALIRQQPGLVAEVEAAPVTRHPYGFYVVQTRIVVDEMPLRFHAWLAGLRIAQQPHWPEHTHKSTMRSFVLDGTLTNLQWQVSGVGYGVPLYTTELAGTRSYLNRSPIEISIGDPAAETVQAGGSYVVPKGVFHDTRVDADKACLTMCWFLNDRSGQSVVAGAIEAPARIETVRTALSEAEARQAKAYCLDVVRRWVGAVERASGNH